MTEKKVYTADFAAIEARLTQLYASPLPPGQLANPLLDLHTITTAVVLEMPYSAVTRRLRGRVGKTLNFAALYTPDAKWSVPEKDALLAIWSDKERAQLCIDFGITRTETLYEVLVKHFTITYRIPE